MKYLSFVRSSEQFRQSGVADSKADALRFTTEFLELHRQHWPEFDCECEVRPIEFQQRA